MKTILSIPVLMLVLDYLVGEPPPNPIDLKDAEPPVVAKNDYGTHWSVWWPPHYV